MAFLGNTPCNVFVSRRARSGRARRIASSSEVTPGNQCIASLPIFLAAHHFPVANCDRFNGLNGLNLRRSRRWIDGINPVGQAFEGPYGLAAVYHVLVKYLGDDCVDSRPLA